MTSLHTSVILKDKSAVFVEFRASYDQNNTLRGTFVTKDEELQYAIEKDNAHGIDWDLESIDGKSPKEYKASTKAKDTNPPKGDNPGDNPQNDAEPPKGDTPPDLIIVPEVVKHQEAKEYLLSKFPETQPGDFKSKVMVVAFAAANKISFPNLA